MIYRRTRRDPPPTEAIRDLLNRWVKTGDPDIAIVAADALRERGHEDLNQTVRNRCRDRRSTRERVFSELLNGGIVIERGEWGQHRRGWRSRTGSPREYVLIFERAPTHWKFRRGFRRGGQPEPRYVLWERYATPTATTSCRWHIWGTYERRDFGGSLDDALSIAHHDIFDMQNR